MRVAWVKLNGWTDTFNERIATMAEHVDEVVLVKPRNSDPDLEPDYPNVSTIDLWPRRGPVLHPRIKVLLFPLWVIQATVAICYHDRMVEPIDVVHSISHPFGALAVRLLTWLDPRPSVASVRGMHMSNATPDETASIADRLQTMGISRLLSAINRLSFTHADFIITKAPFQIEFVRERFRLRDVPMTDIPTGVDLSMFDPSSVSPDHDLLRSLVGESVDDEMVVLYFGRMVESKGVRTFLETIAASDSPDDVRFLLVGAFPDQSFQTSMEQFIVDNDLTDRVTIHSEYLPFERIPGLIRAVDAVTLLSKPGVEGVPRVLQEACLLETPVIAADVAGITAAFRGHDGCFLVPRGDPAAFTAALDRARSEHPERDVFSEVFSLYRNYGRYADIYGLVTGRTEVNERTASSQSIEPRAEAVGEHDE